MPRPAAPIPPHADLIKLYRAALANAHDLADDASLLAANGRYSRAYALATLAWEELSKAHQCITAVILPSYTPDDFWRTFGDHQPKLARAHAIDSFLENQLFPNAKLSNSEAKQINELKERALYIGYKHGRILQPNIGQQKCLAHVKSTIESVKRQEELFTDYPDDASFLDYLQNFGRALQSIQPRITELAQTQDVRHQDDIIRLMREAFLIED